MSDPGDFRAAIIGCGRMGARSSAGLQGLFPPGWLPLSHAEAICSTPGLRLCAVSDVDNARAEAASEAFGGVPAYPDWRRMIREIQPEVLSIATRTEGRCEMIRFAAEQGVKAIHAEKPLGRSLTEYAIALDAVEAFGVHLSYGTTRRFMDAYRKAKELVETGELGAVRQVTLEFGKTWLLWSHPHSMDLMLFLGGCCEVEFVQASGTFPAEAFRGNVLDADPVIDFAHVQFANGLGGTITSGTGLNTRVAGEKGSLVVASDGTRVEWDVRANPEVAYQLRRSRWEPRPERSGTQTAMREVVAALRQGTPLSISPREIQLAGELLSAAAWSVIHEGRRVRISEVPPDFTVTGRVGANLA